MNSKRLQICNWIITNLRVDCNWIITNLRVDCKVLPWRSLYLLLATMFQTLLSFDSGQRLRPTPNLINGWHFLAEPLRASRIRIPPCSPVSGPAALPQGHYAPPHLLQGLCTCKAGPSGICLLGSGVTGASKFHLADRKYCGGDKEAKQRRRLGERECVWWSVASFRMQDSCFMLLFFSSCL